jgi:DNA-binding MarR family transcriptional regulator
MLGSDEIKKLLNKKDIIKMDEELVKKSSSWDLDDFGVTPQLIGTIYRYMNICHKDGESMTDMESRLGIALESISKALKALEHYGYIAISRLSKPYRYSVIK